MYLLDILEQRSLNMREDEFVHLLVRHELFEQLQILVDVFRPERQITILIGQ